MDCLTKEQMLLLQNHLPYAKYEEFMSMFEEETILPKSKKDKIEQLLTVDGVAKITAEKFVEKEILKLADDADVLNVRVLVRVLSNLNVDERVRVNVENLGLNQRDDLWMS